MRTLNRTDYLPRPACGERAGVRGCFSSSKKSIRSTPLQILMNIVVPDADHAITERIKIAVALPVVRAIRMLAAVELDDQAPLATNKVGRGSDQRAEFEATELPTANVDHNVNSAGVSARRNDRARSARL